MYNKILILILIHLVLINCNDVNHVKNLNQLYKSANYYGNYSCDEITRWLGLEKHYSNQNKEVLFNILKKHNLEYRKENNVDYCISYKEPVVYLKGVSYSNVDGLQSAQLTTRHYQKKYKNSVIFLSNYSINNNYSHFLHGLLRLFCALLDAQWIVYNEINQLFEFKVHYQVLLDPLVKMNPTKLKWLSAFVAKPTDIIHLKVTNDVYIEHLLYGNGCFKLLPPEKWFGYPGCRATTILPTFNAYMKNIFDTDTTKQYYIKDRVNNMYLTLMENTNSNTNTNSDNDNQLSNIDSKFNYPLLGRKMPMLKIQKEYIKKISITNKNTNIHTTPVIPIIAFAIRQNSDTPQTGMRSINKLVELQNSLAASLRIPSILTNITFEQYDVPTTIDIMSSIHVFISVHGAGMTNMFFMNPVSISTYTYIYIY